MVGAADTNTALATRLLLASLATTQKQPVRIPPRNLVEISDQVLLLTGPVFEGEHQQHVLV